MAAAASPLAPADRALNLQGPGQNPGIWGQEEREFMVRGVKTWWWFKGKEKKKVKNVFHGKEERKRKNEVSVNQCESLYEEIEWT